MIAAILRAQLLSMRLRAGSRAPSIIFSLFTGVLYYGFWAFFAVSAMVMFSLPARPEDMAALISTALLFATVYWQLAPLLTASFGASLDLRKLLVYPVPPRKLFAIEMLLRLTNCGEMLLIMCGIAAGLLKNPHYGPKTAPLIVAGALAFVAMNVFTSAGTRFWIERWFRTSRWKEIAFLVFIAMCFAPKILIRAHPDRKLLLRLAPSEIFWPWSAAGRMMIADEPALALIIGAAWVTAAFWFSRKQFYRSLRFDASEVKKPEHELRLEGISERLFRVPSRFLPDPVAAIIEKELRVLTRISRVRVVFVISALAGVMLYMPYMVNGGQQRGVFFENALPVVAVYALLTLAQLTYWNSFGFDRSAAMGYFCWPIRLRHVLIAKNVAAALLVVPQIAVVWAVTAVMRLPASPAKFVEAIVVMVTAGLYWFGLGNIASVRLPRAMDPDKMTQMSGKMQALTIWAAPLLLLPVVLAYVARAVFHSEIVFAGMILIALLLGAIFYYVSLDSAVTTAQQRREALLDELSRAEGPVSIA